MRSEVKSKMKRAFIACLLVSGLVGTAFGVDDNVESETQESGTNLNFRFLDKNKRGATKITNTDNPSFNHLTTSNAASTSTSGFKASPANTNPTPFRYLYNQQYYQPNPYITYVPIPQAAQIASQYSFQSNPVAHFLQTPTQIQYVATPTVAQVPQIKYQTFSTGNPTVSEATSSATNSQYLSQSQQTAQAPTPAVASQSKQIQTVQAPLYSDYQPVYYTQQPVFTYFPQPQAANYIYHNPNANYLLRQQQQQQIASIYGANRFGFYTPTQNAQLTYVVPMIVQPEDSRATTTTTTTNVKSDKVLSNSQQTSSANSFSFGTKA